MANEITPNSQKPKINERLLGVIQNELSKIKSEEGSLPEQFDLTHDELVKSIQDVFTAPGRRYGSTDSD